MTGTSLESSASPRPNALLVTLTLANVAMQLTSALLLKFAPEPALENMVPIALAMAGVLVLNVVRFLTWGALHKRFPVSLAYPASALVFPGILVMAWWFGEPVARPQIVGAMLVLFGVALLLTQKEAQP